MYSISHLILLSYTMLCEAPWSNFKLIRRYINLLNLFIIYLYIKGKFVGLNGTLNGKK